MDKVSREYARLVAGLKRNAEKRGDRQAALFLLQEFVNHADEFERARFIPVSDRLVIRFLARAVFEILQGIKPTTALCLDTGGRPEVPIERDLLLAMLVYGKYEQFKDRARSAEGGAVDWAISAIARERKTSKPTVRAAWKRFNGVKGMRNLMTRIGEA